MATEDIVTIKPAGGGDYTSLNAAESAERANLVTGDKILVFEVYSGGNCLTGAISFNTGWTTDATRYIEIRAAAGHQHRGVWNTAKAYGQYNTGSGDIISVAKNVNINKMQFYSDMAGSGGTQAVIHANGAGAIMTIDRCIIISTGNWTPLDFFLENSSVINIYNSILLQRQTTNGYTSLNVKVYSSSTLTAYNCNIISIAPQASAECALQTVGTATVNTQNCYFKCFATRTYWNYDAAGTFNAGDKDMTSNADATTASYRNIAYSTANFKSVTWGSENLHLTIASALIAKGQDLSGTFTTDIDGDTREKWSVGVDDDFDPGGNALLLSIW